MGQYATQTAVTTDRSLGEIRKLLSRYGADGFAFGEEATQAAVQFRMRDRTVRLVIALPDREHRSITRTPTGLLRSTAQQAAAYEQQVRARWRSLVLIIKAKLEAVESGVVSFEQEWLPYIQLPSGETVSEWLAPQIEAVYGNHEMPPLLPGATYRARLLGTGESS